MIRSQTRRPPGARAQFNDQMVVGPLPGALRYGLPESLTASAQKSS